MSAACRLSALTVILLSLLGLAAAGPWPGAAAAAPGAATAVSPTAPLAGTAAAVAVAVAPIAAPATAAVRPTANAPVSEASPAVLRGVGGLSPRALAMALDAVSCARARGVAGRDGLLTLIDYSLPSTAPRLWVLDLAHGKVLFHELVAHGAGSGDNYATHFSNTQESRQSSLGLFLTGGTYEGGNGYSLRLRGLDTAAFAATQAPNGG